MMDSERSTTNPGGTTRGGPHLVRQVAARAARRGTFAVCLTRCGTTLLIGSNVFLLAMLLDWWFALGLPVWGVGAVCLGLSIVVGIGATWRARWSMLEGARRLDETNGLHDALTSALELDDGDGFSALAKARAERLSSEVDVTRVSELRPGLAWVIWPLLGAGAVASTFLSPASRMEPTTDPAEVEPIARTLDDVSVDEEERAFLDDVASDLEGLEEELRAGAAAEALDERADELEDRVSRARDADEALRERLEQVEDESPLGEALREGDYAKARELLQERARELESMSEEDRARFADDLDRLAQDLRGDEPQAGDVPSLDDLRERLESEGLTPDDALEEAIREREELERERATSEGEADARDLREALERAADRIRETPPTVEEPPGEPREDRTDSPETDPSTDREDPQEGDQSSEREGAQEGDQSSEREGAQEGEQSSEREGAQEGEQSSERDGAQEGEQSSEREGAQEGEQSSEREGAQDGEQSSEREGAQEGEQSSEREGAQEGEQSSEREGAQEGEQSSEREGAQEGEQSSEREGAQDGEQSSEREGAQEGEQSSEREGAQEGEQSSEREGPQDGEQSSEREGGQEGDQVEGVRRTDGPVDEIDRVLREAESRREGIRRDGETATRLREEADRLLDRTPHSGPTEDVQVDAPPSDEVRERTIAEYAGEGAEGARDGAMTSRMREAAAGAERAIERERVPTHRSDLVRRYFERIRESAERARDATDAEPGGS